MSAAYLLRRLDRSVWSVTGGDRVGYLQRMLSQDVARLEPGRATYACVLTPRGKILGDPVVWNDGDRFLLDLSRPAAAQAIPTLERYVIADDVVFEDVTTRTARWVLLGGGASAALERAGTVPPEPLRFVRGRLGTAEVLVLRRDLGARPALEGMSSASDEPAVLAALRRDPSVEEIDVATFETHRIEEGVPSFERELSEAAIPNEARLDSALSFAKGCFPGQEPVVMARHRGHPANLLVHLAIHGRDPPPPGTALRSGSDSIGRITSAARRVSDRGVRALAYVRYAAATPGARFEIEGGGTAETLDDGPRG